MRMDLSTRQLRALVEVVEEGTFTDAAIALGTSQASVSRMIASLEKAVGARLLRRTSRSVSLTAAGETTFAHARHVLAEVDRLARALNTSGRSIRLGYPWSALGQHTTAVVGAWSERHPSIRLDLVQSISPTAGLLEGLADIAVVRTGLRDRRSAEEVVGHEPRYAAVPAADPLARRRVLRMADFEGRRVAVDPLTGSTPRDLWASAGVDVQVEEVRGVDAWLTLIASGRALGMAAESTTHEYQRPDIRYRRVKDADSVEVRLLWWADDPPPHVEDFLRLVRKQLGG
jgi:DNA-binding transcriptional LysR family regulator